MRNTAPDFVVNTLGTAKAGHERIAAENVRRDAERAAAEMREHIAANRASAKRLRQLLREISDVEALGSHSLIKENGKWLWRGRDITLDD